MLTNDQRALNGLLFVRNIRDQLLLEEWGSSERNMARSGAVASSST